MTEDGFLEDVERKLELLETDDVGQKRYVMYRVFDSVLEKNYSFEEEELPGTGERVKKLQEFDGYMYKLSQEFLTSSSTLEKRRKLEKMVERLERKLG